ncbi:DNA mismatch repair protein [Pleosporales sp. CAS-2024a]
MSHTRTPSTRPIQPLPADVAAQIEASAAIVSLGDAVLGLLANALDAHAARIDVTLDFPRGACTLEDDGLGIPPAEFSPDGRLAQLHSTSKHKAPEALLGRHGLFLASLSAVSLLSITSRHCHSRSHNSLTIHHATVIQRQLPAPSHHAIHGKHGTRVTVRNLFGNLPVRIKHRRKIAERKAEHDQLWEDTRHRIVGLLLSSGRSVTLRARDADNHVVFAFTKADAPQPGCQPPLPVPKPPPNHLTSLLRLLTQAKYISAHEWSAWVPVSASTAAWSIRGAISLEPSPSQCVQFISLGVHPLTSGTDAGGLYHQVNRLFHLSTFGTEDDSIQHMRREGVPQLDSRQNPDRLRGRSLQARKGVDRYPMFHLRIAPCEDTPKEVGFNQHVSSMQAVSDVLDAMITQWLQANHFCPQQPRHTKRRFNSGREENPATDVTLHNQSPCDLVLPPASQPVPAIAPGPSASKRQRSDARPLSGIRITEPTSAFAKWSRIKTGKVDFLDVL